MAKKVTINEALILSKFDEAPNSSQVRLPVVRAVLGGISAATVWRMAKAGTLRAYKLTPRTTTFNVGELRSLLAAKAVA